MLKSRLLTAFSMGPLILWAIYAMPEHFFAAFAFVLVSIGAWEWSVFAGWLKPIQRKLFLFVNVVLFVVVLLLQHMQLNIVIILSSLVWWLVCIPLLLNFPFKENNIFKNKTVTTLIGFVLLLAMLVAMVSIRNNYSSGFILYLVFIIWFADSGAYFAGRALGKNKLIPNVSPGKTWEGVAGAVATTLIVSIVSLYLLDIPSSNSIAFIVVTLVTVIYSIVGDLSESMFKRMANVKDSGSLLPGHGGMLDRIDSLISGAPVFCAGLWIMEKLG